MEYSHKWAFKPWIGENKEIDANELPKGSIANMMSHIARSIVSGPFIFDNADIFGWTSMTPHEYKDLLAAYSDFVGKQIG